MRVNNTQTSIMTQPTGTESLFSQISGNYTEVEEVFRSLFK